MTLVSLYVMLPHHQLLGSSVLLYDVSPEAGQVRGRGNMRSRHGGIHGLGLQADYSPSICQAVAGGLQPICVSGSSRGTTAYLCVRQ